MCGSLVHVSIQNLNQLRGANGFSTTPAQLHKVFPEMSKHRWRGFGEVATHAHIWWLCLLIRPFCSSILKWIEVIQGVPIPSDSWVVLFHCTGEPVGWYWRSITPHFLIAAKSLIPRFWKQSTIHYCSTMVTCGRPHTAYHMEDNTYECRDLVPVAHKIWASWFAFTHFSKYAEIMFQANYLNITCF